jgi:hypothetical protein
MYNTTRPHHTRLNRPPGHTRQRPQDTRSSRLIETLRCVPIGTATVTRAGAIIDAEHMSPPDRLRPGLAAGRREESPVVLCRHVTSHQTCPISLFGLAWPGLAWLVALHPCTRWPGLPKILLVLFCCKSVLTRFEVMIVMTLL